MLLIKIVDIDIRGIGQNSKTVEMEVNKVLMDLQKKGCKLVGEPRLFHNDLGKMVYTIAYEDTRMDENAKDE